MKATLGKSDPLLGYHSRKGWAIVVWGAWRNCEPKGNAARPEPAVDSYPVCRPRVPVAWAQKQIAPTQSVAKTGGNEGDRGLLPSRLSEHGSACDQWRMGLSSLEMSRAFSLFLACAGGCTNTTTGHSDTPAAPAPSDQQIGEREALPEARAPEFKTETGEPYAVQTPQQSKELAESAAAEHLDPKRTWRTSPLLPGQWPPVRKEVVVLMYPLAAHPQRMNHYQLYSAAFRVRVSLIDGATEVEPLKNSRKLGALVEGRATSLERRELDMAENTLFRYVAAEEEDRGEDSFWGYRKYFHEHPQYARDITRHAPRFVKWVRSQ